MTERQKKLRNTWRDDLNEYISRMGSKIDRIHVTPSQARKLMNVKDDEEMPERPWRYMGKEVLVHDEEAS